MEAQKRAQCLADMLGITHEREIEIIGDEIREAMQEAVRLLHTHIDELQDEVRQLRKLNHSTFRS